MKHPQLIIMQRLTLHHLRPTHQYQSLNCQMEGLSGKPSYTADRKAQLRARNMHELNRVEFYLRTFHPTSATFLLRADL